MEPCEYLQSMTFLFLKFDHISMRSISKVFWFKIILLFTVMPFVVECVRLVCTQLTINRFSTPKQHTEIATVVRLLGFVIQGQVLSLIWFSVSPTQSQNLMWFFPFFEINALHGSFWFTPFTQKMVNTSVIFLLSNL